MKLVAQFLCLDQIIATGAQTLARYIVTDLYEVPAPTAYYCPDSRVHIKGSAGYPSGPVSGWKWMTLRVSIGLPDTSWMALFRASAFLSSCWQ